MTARQLVHISAPIRRSVRAPTESLTIRRVHGATSAGCRVRRVGPRRRWPSGWRRRGTARTPTRAGHGHHGDDSGKLLFFASDGLTQSKIEEFADDGVTPGLPGAAQARRVRVRPRPADAGAAEHRRGLVHAGHRRVAGRARLDEQHVPHRNGATRSEQHSTFSSRRRAERPAGRDARAGGRARRQEGRADRVGGRAQRRRSTARPSTTAASSPAAAWRRTTSRRPTTSRSRASFGAAVRPPGRVRRQRAVPAGRAHARDGLDERAALLLAREGDAPARPRRQRRTSTASTRTSTTAATTAARQLRPRALQPHQERRRQGRRPRRGRSVRRREGQDHRRRERGQDRRPSWSRSSGSRRDLTQVRLFHTSRHARVRDAGRASPSAASPARSRTSSPSASRPRRPATSPCSRPAS